MITSWGSTSWIQTHWEDGSWLSLTDWIDTIRPTMKTNTDIDFMDFMHQYNSETFPLTNGPSPNFLLKRHYSFHAQGKNTQIPLLGRNLQILVELERDTWPTQTTSNSGAPIGHFHHSVQFQFSDPADIIHSSLQDSVLKHFTSRMPLSSPAYQLSSDKVAGNLEFPGPASWVWWI